MRVKHKKKLNKRVVLLLVGAVLLVGAGVWAWQMRKPAPAQNQSTATGTTPDSEPIDYGPPTEEEKKLGDTQKDSNVAQQQRESQQSSGAKAVKPTINDVGHYDQIEARSYITTIFEDGGTCTFKFTQGSSTITKTSQGFKDATTTTCKPLYVPRSEFPASGQWSLVVSYESGTAKGSSDPRTFEVH